MNVRQDITNDTHKAGAAPTLMILESDAGLLKEDLGKLTEHRMEEIDKRAKTLGPVLEAILREQHGQPRWGLNE